MILASWNCNSLTVRMPRVLEFLDLHQPDVLCLQETKVRTETVPHLELQMAGYTAIDHSSGGRNGVAILVKDGLDVQDVTRGLPGEPNPDEARWIDAVVQGIRIVSVYVPNGRSPEDPAFTDKLRFLQALTDRASAWADGRTIVTGDFNIAPGDLDVYDPVRYIGTTHTSAKERQTLTDLGSVGFVDAFRHLHPEQQTFSWWDYRGGNFHKNLGMRIDLFMVSEPLHRSHDMSYEMARDFRKGTKPSDHAPIILRLTP
ncbi:exodeoxyribonuclease III [Euzebya tangerina]|uniref:exodeoxyribonuclease III n=1 Tax=Euzebya tangerina TaxID=591198 RepID=UPI000E30E095|nr:exodeoxyribonuclease III [Euzebya tangerina]